MLHDSQAPFALVVLLIIRLISLINSSNKTGRGKTALQLETVGTLNDGSLDFGILDRSVGLHVLGL
jgi:hypothetical protein